MNESEHRKQMLLQQIADHRELMRLEVEVLRDANPVVPMVRRGRQLIGALGALRAGRGAGDGHALSHLNLELASTVLPAVLQVLRVVLRRREEKHAREQHS